MCVAVCDSCTSDFELLTMLWAMFDGSITVHWAAALPVPRNRQRAMRGIKNLICFIQYGLMVICFPGTDGDYLHNCIEQHERERE